MPQADSERDHPCRWGVTQAVERRYRMAGSAYPSKSASATFIDHRVLRSRIS